MFRLLWKRYLVNTMAKPVLAQSQLCSTLNVSELVKPLISTQSMTAVKEANANKLKDDYIKMSTSTRDIFLKDLAAGYSCDITAINNILSTWKPTEGHIRQEQRLREALIPQYEQIFTEIGASQGGVKFLVDLRKDLLVLIKRLNVSGEESATLQAMNLNLKKILSMWFGVGFLNLERITWDSSCDLVQKIAEYEGVHPVRNLTDLRVRVGPYRRCYAFLHASMPQEPIVVLHTALVNEISDNIHDIVKHSNPVEPPSSEYEDKTSFNTAIFYSITSTQAGLQGIELGNYLIKKVVGNLQSEHPHLTQFSSLSPIPGFRDWLITEINQRTRGSTVTPVLTQNQIDDLCSVLNCQNDEISTLNALKSVLLRGDWFKDNQLSSALKSPITQLCARYLFSEKRRTYALNPVANFHLRNGATLWRLNWLANTTGRGMAASCGMMVNYRYHLNKLEQNSESYIMQKKIDVDNQVLEKLPSSLLNSRL